MSSLAVTQNIPLHPTAEGVIRVGETRVTLDTVIEAFKEGLTAEAIVSQYPSLELADVYVVLGYYLRYPAEVEGYLRERRTLAETVRLEVESRFDPIGIRDRLLARRP